MTQRYSFLALLFLSNQILHNRAASRLATKSLLCLSDLPHKSSETCPLGNKTPTLNIAKIFCKLQQRDTAIVCALPPLCQPYTEHTSSGSSRRWAFSFCGARVLRIKILKNTFDLFYLFIFLKVWFSKRHWHEIESWATRDLTQKRPLPSCFHTFGPPGF